jgi:acetyl esterase/lipase
MHLTRKTGWGRLAAAVLLAALAWLAARYRQNLQFFYKLFQAQREAGRYYAGCATLTKNVSPHPSVRTRLDVYQPEGARDCPVLIYIYGGSWNGGNKTLYAPMAQRLLPEGIVLVIPDYTTYPAARFPQPTEEIAAAIAWTLDNIQQYGGDPRRVVVAAQSAGAQVAGVALLDPRWLAAHRHSAAEVRGFLGISGVYDVPAQITFAQQHGRWGRYIEDVMGGRANLAAASPINFVSAAAPPALLIHGDADPTVPMRMSEAFDERLRAAGVESELVTYRGGGHSGILFEALAENPSRLVTDMLRFVRQVTEVVKEQEQGAG